MVKPYGRTIRQKVGKILENPDREIALEQLARIPDNQLTGHLFSHFYTRKDLIKFRSVTAMGFVGKRLAQTHMESARNLMRRLMWNLNDESGGIGWGSAEAMGEVLSHSRNLAAEFDSILFSFVDQNANYIDNPLLQQGILWGIKTYVTAAPDRLTPDRAGLLVPFLDCEDPVKRGYAVRALRNAGSIDTDALFRPLSADHTEIAIYNQWHFEPARICDLVRADAEKTAWSQAAAEKKDVSHGSQKM
jgi:hypothetical protein